MITKDFFSKREFHGDKPDVVHIRSCGSDFMFQIGDKEEIVEMRYYPHCKENLVRRYVPNELKTKNLAVIMAWLRPLREWRHVEKTLNEWVLN